MSGQWDAVRGVALAVDERDLVERLAALEHVQWMEWANAIMASEPVSKRRRDRWQRFMVPYDRLPDDVKEHDRVWARKVLRLILDE